MKLLKEFSIKSSDKVCGTAEPPIDRVRNLFAKLDGIFYALFYIVTLGISIFIPTPVSAATDNHDRVSYAHPFRDVKAIDGKIPLLDIKNSPEGQRYAVVELSSVVSEDSTARIEHYSGLVTLERRKVEPGSSSPGFEGPFIDRLIVGPPEDKIAPSLRSYIKSLHDTNRKESILVEINLKARDGETLQHRMDRAIAAGLVRTKTDAREMHRRLLDEIAQEVVEQVRPLVQSIQKDGGELIYVCEYATCLTAKLAPEHIMRLAEIAEVHKIAKPAVLSDADSLDGFLINETYQTRPFWDFSYIDGGVTYHLDGDNGQDTDVTFAILERSGFRTTHRAFRDGSVSGSRIRGAFDCDGLSCVAGSWDVASLSLHPTAALGSVFADYTDGQDPNVINAVAREERSAPGREAKAWIYDVGSSSASSLLAYNHLVARSPKPNLVSYSIPEIADDSNCQGTDTRSRNVDQVLFENGVLMFIAAGNSGGTASDCRVWSPGSAAGAFTVGGWGKSNTTYTDACDVRDEGMNTNSSWGGSLTTASEGRRRSIIDVTGAYCQAKRPAHTSDTAFGSFCGTSAATPSVVGAAIDLIDNYKTNHSNFINDPGVLFTWMLMMGDRSTSGQADNLGLNGKLWGRFDHRFGAGKLRMRMLNSEGMDAPYITNSGWTCVDHGEIYTFPIANGQRLSSDFDSAKAVIWWYDRRMHDSPNQAIDNIDLRLKTVAGVTLQSSTDPYDNKERVYYRDVGGKAVKMEITGQNVSADNAGCGTNSMKVYFAILVEDDDRDDADGPSWDPVACEGVEPL